jgi:hypothetical protein
MDIQTKTIDDYYSQSDFVEHLLYADSLESFYFDVEDICQALVEDICGEIYQADSWICNAFNSRLVRLSCYSIEDVRLKIVDSIEDCLDTLFVALLENDDWYDDWGEGYCILTITEKDKSDMMLIISNLKSDLNKFYGSYVEYVKTRLSEINNVYQPAEYLFSIYYKDLIPYLDET